MSKQVRFDDNVQEHTMSVDGETHKQEVQDPLGAGIPMIAPAVAQTTGFMGLSWWWILLILLVAVVVGYFGWKYYTKKTTKEDHTKAE